jgi:hypothetical protein
VLKEKAITLTEKDHKWEEIKTYGKQIFGENKKIVGRKTRKVERRINRIRFVYE